MSEAAATGSELNAGLDSADASFRTRCFTTKFAFGFNLCVGEKIPQRARIETDHPYVGIFLR